MAGESTTTIKKGGTTTTIVRRSAKDGGTYSYTTTSSDSTPKNFKGGSNNNSTRKATKQSVGIQDAETQAKTASAVVKQNLQATQSQTVRQVVSTKTQLGTQSHIDLQSGEYSPVPNGQRSYIDLVNNPGVATNVDTGDTITASQAKYISAQANNERGFFEGLTKGSSIYKSETIGNALKGRDPLTGNTLPYTNPSTILKKETTLSDPLGAVKRFAGAKVVKPKPSTWGSSTDYQKGDAIGTGVSLVSTGLGKFAIWAGSAGVELASDSVKAYKTATRREGTIFAPVPFVKGNPAEQTAAKNEPQFLEAKREGFKSSKEYYADQPFVEFKLSGIKPNVPKIGSYVLPATFADSKSYQKGVRDYYIKEGLTGKELELALNAQKTELRASRVADAGLVFAEVGGELVGGGKFKKPVSKTAEFVTNHVDEATVLGKYWKKIRKSAGAGNVEAGVGVASVQQNIDDDIDYKQITGARVIGAGTAGTFTAVQIASKGWRKGGVTGLGYITEPLEVVGDVSSTPFKKGLSKLGLDFTDDAPVTFSNVFTTTKTDTKTNTKTNTNGFVQSKKGSSSSRSGKSSSNTFTYTKDSLPTTNDAFNFGNSKINTNIPTIVDTNTNTVTVIKTPVNTNTNTKIETQIETFTDTFVQTNTKTNTLTNSFTNTFTYVPEFAPIALGGGFGSRGFNFKARGKQSKAYTPSAFAVIGNIKGSKSKGGTTTGLGLRPILSTSKKKTKTSKRLFNF